MSMRLLSLQLFLAFAVANARNDPPPSSERSWAPPNLPNYERDLSNGEVGSRVAINPRKIYNLAELIDIAERNNPETRVAWERARQAAARRDHPPARRRRQQSLWRPPPHGRGVAGCHRGRPGRRIRIPLARGAAGVKRWMWWGLALIGVGRGQPARQRPTHGQPGHHHLVAASGQVLVGPLGCGRPVRPACGAATSLVFS